LIIGGAGFVGSNLAHYWSSKYPNDVIGVFDKLTYAGDRSRLEGVKHQFYWMDSGRASDVLNCFNDFKPDIVWNGGCETHVDRSIQDPESFIRPNITGTVNVLNVARLRPAHIIHMSTDETLLHKPPVCIDDFHGIVEKPVSEKSRWQFYRPSEDNCEFFPQNPYAASKLAAEAMVWSYRNTYRMPITIIRATNMYGPRQYPEKLIPLAITKLLNNEKIPVYGDGNFWRDYLYVDDFCRAFDLVSSQRPGGDWHVSANSEKTNLEVLDTLLPLLGKDRSSLDFVSDRPGHDRSYSLSSQKIRNLGWSPQILLSEGLTKTIEHLKIRS
jgi:dTDP-glucose 4,6-dehydratase